MDNFLIMEDPALLNQTTTTTTTQQESTTPLDTLIEVSTNERKRKRFRLQAKNLFFTYPQCNVNKEDALEKFKKYYGEDLVWIVVAHEFHEDGGDHLHVAISLKEKKTQSSLKKLDKILNFHGNYQAMKNMLNVLKYVIKDGEYISEGIDVEKFIKLRLKKKSTVVALTLVDGDICDVNEFDPGFCLMHLKKIREYKDWLDNSSKKRQKLGHGSLVFTTSSNNSSVKQVVDWLNKNILQEREFKQKQLFITSPPNMGKTSLINKLEKAGVRVFYLPPDEDFYCQYDNGLYDLIVLDEFMGQKRIQDLNRWLDGSLFPVRRKGTTPIIKNDNLPFIICSNFSLEQAYSKSDYTRLEPLNERITCIPVTAFLDIDVTPREAEVSFNTLSSSPPHTCDLLDFSSPLPTTELLNFSDSSFCSEERPGQILYPVTNRTYALKYDDDAFQNNEFTQPQPSSEGATLDVWEEGDTFNMLE